MFKNLSTRMNKKLAPPRVKDDVRLAIQLELHFRINKNQISSGSDVTWS